MARRMTPEQRQEYNRRKRERYQKARQAGFTRDQARSMEKALRESPEILAEPTEAIIDVISGINKFAKWLDPTTETKKEDNPLSGLLDWLTGKQPTRKKPTPDIRIQTSRSKPGIIPFPDFVDQNRHLSGREIKRRYREEIGGRISDRKADEIIREIKGLDYNPKKATRKPGDRPKRPQHKAPRKNYQFTKKRYVYLLGYDVRDKHKQVFRRYIHIPSDVPLTVAEAKQAVLDYWLAEMEQQEEKYTNVDIIPESIYLVEAYDLTKTRKGA